MEFNAETKPYNTADYLDSEEGDAADIRSALGKVAKARGITGLSKEICVAHKALYEALGKDGNPTLDI